MAVESAQSNALDVVIKYSVILTAFAYAGGFVEEAVYLLRLGAVNDFRLTNPIYFVVGIVLLFAAFVPSILIGLEPHPHAQTMAFRLGMASIIFLAEFAWAFWSVGAWVRDSLAVATVGAALAVLAHKALTDGDGFSRASFSAQVRALYQVSVFFLFFAAAVGQAEWRSMMQHEGGHKVRLLVAPDAVPAAEQLGVVFPARNATQNSAAGLSAPVVILIEGERNYTLRLDKTHFTSISKEKIWGFVSEPR